MYYLKSFHSYNYVCTIYDSNDRYYIKKYCVLKNPGKQEKTYKLEFLNIKRRKTEK